MARPLIEFIQSQRLEWQDGAELAGRPGTRVKLLSIDTATGARTMLVQYPSGYEEGRTGALECDEELFVLSGALEVNATAYALHGYAYLPPRYPRTRFASAPGAIALTFLNGAPRPVASASADDAAVGLIKIADTSTMAWDTSDIDPNVNHLQTARKNLRFALDGQCRTYLLSGRAQGRPPQGVAHRERHPHVEEFFFVYGDMSCHVGVMRAGAYSWRPPGVWHGLDCTRSGFLIFFRSPGANRNVNEWEPALSPVPWSPVHRPTLPPDLAARFPTPLPDPIEY